MLAIHSHTPLICAAPALQHPAAQQATAALYAALSQLSLSAGQQRHGAAGQCAAVLTLAELLLGFLAPTLLLAAGEAQLYRRWRSHWLDVQQQQQPGEPAGGLEARTSSGAASAQHDLPVQPRERKLEAGAHPALQPPSALAACCYDFLHACLSISDPPDAVMAALTAGLLLCAAWRAILQLTPL